MSHDFFVTYVPGRSALKGCFLSKIAMERCKFVDKAVEKHRF